MYRRLPALLKKNFNIFFPTRIMNFRMNKHRPKTQHSKSKIRKRAKKAPVVVAAVPEAVPEAAPRTRKTKVCKVVLK